ncbi:MAG: hypothetical protein E7Z84_01635 [Methanosphaera stadtmanae]|nr:hypothetical protein [Methanosphaera stadtmanae]
MNSTQINIARCAGRIVAAVVLSIIAALILGAISHFIFGDWNIAIIFVFILVAASSSGPSITDIESKSLLIITGIIGSIIVYYLIRIILPMVFGPAYVFPFSLFGLGEYITGLIITIIIGILTSLLVWSYN